MAGNSKRRGAVRKAGSKKGPQVGSGGQRRRGLKGRGPTPKATEREYHPAAKRAAAAAKRDERQPRRAQPQRQTTPDLELVTGRNAVLEVVRAGTPVERVYLAARAESDDRLSEVLRTVTARHLPLVEATKGELDKLTDGANHQGIAIQVPPYEYTDPAALLDRVAGGPPLIVALDGVTDPHNLGAVLRSAGAFGVHGVVVPERRAAGVTATVWKVSAGAAARVPVARATNLVRALQDYKKAGCFVVGLDGQASTSVSDLELATEPLVVVVGSEGKGLSRLVRETCDAIAGIEISSRVESLNAAVATGISLYEIARIRATR
ncbi:23S rRNA (guanosine(2251)-2'-O)-methyltransferase RlmB [Georgenia sp. 311]|uniref:23S rRNA (Guanosine(2251)-2'-O)-methyltransferase RlmB n=1 Tax=Georgenia wutianyii TaxID=2585135 RepID=A0ABX5VII1_9MICO|nr:MULTISPECIES: 23S rRNA (guanosine(2251)-2'-O)-methyltransferase RlmB [Georgenia]QDB78132.1 23S rRNA (guanosine(2251)-2'-O)-methyltransferase RlmB [Georgenia wutianyii]TNC17578.1 23S rRNA (guanosine(2251)-2'-O)-methyltransferase RlmB [Georgenia sp. 311]